MKWILRMCFGLGIVACFFGIIKSNPIMSLLGGLMIGMGSHGWSD